MQELDKAYIMAASHSLPRVSRRWEIALPEFRDIDLFFTGKRLLDLFLSTIFIISFLPFYLILAIITYASSHGPALYKQERIGRNGQSFTMYKFRSMKAEAEGEIPLLAVPNDPRITRWGRFMRRYKLDETPQFFNVLKGSMSIVGPRPERAYFKDQLSQQDARLEDLTTVKPGITSLGQIKFGYASDLKQMQRRARFDLLYLRNLSLGTDLKIIVLTFLHVIRGEGSLSASEK